MRRITIFLLFMMFFFFLRAQKYPEPVYTIKGIAIKGYDTVAFLLRARL
ncbi:MAG: hypothetical protein GY816_03610 [Cytophagales bacterium]|nr:hypothetical protein [Cytophagales bacterium]